MNLKTLDKKDAINVLNTLSIIMAWGLTCYFFDSVVTSNAVEMLGDILLSPVYITDNILSSFTDFSVSGNFNLMFIVLWLSYAGPLTLCYPVFMVRNHEASELRKWYLSKGSAAN